MDDATAAAVRAVSACLDLLSRVMQDDMDVTDMPEVLYMLHRVLDYPEVMGC